MHKDSDPKGEINLRPSFKEAERLGTLTPEYDEIVPLDNVLGLYVVDGEPSERELQAMHQMLHLDPSTKAIILDANPSGAIPDNVVPVIQEATDMGQVVFVLPRNHGTDHGILEIKYRTHKDVAAAGAVLIKSKNFNDLTLVSQAIQRAINDGLIGAELRQKIIDQFGVAEPPPE